MKPQLPQLPPNPPTIASHRPAVTDTSWLGFGERGELLKIEAQLRLLRQHDSYERMTSPEREVAKAALLARKQELTEKVPMEKKP